MTWHFTSILADLAEVNPPRPVPLIVKNQQERAIMSSIRPNSIAYIYLRYPHSIMAASGTDAITNTVISDVPIKGYVQSDQKIDKDSLNDGFGPRGIQLGVDWTHRSHTEKFACQTPIYEYLFLHGSATVKLASTEAGDSQSILPEHFPFPFII
jgi:hypothetical protein